MLYASPADVWFPWCPQGPGGLSRAGPRLQLHSLRAMRPSDTRVVGDPHDIIRFALITRVIWQAEVVERKLQRLLPFEG